VSLTAWQLEAITHPCLIAEETAHPRFGHITVNGTVVLSVNAGYE
jgi:hypothetical protein